MPRARTSLALALLAGLLTPAAGSAATGPTPVCLLVKDARGDDSGVVGEERALDILSGDLASDARTVTAVVRLAGPPVKAGDPNAPEGADYYFLFDLPDAAHPVYLAASSDARGAYSYAMGDVEPAPGGRGDLYADKPGLVRGSVKGSVITLRVARADLAPLGNLRPGVRATGLGVKVFVPVAVPGVGGLLETADEAQSRSSYVGGTPSCVKP